MIEIEWDPAKARANLRKHGISFDEAKSVFSDHLSLTIIDAAHSDATSELRFLTLGESSPGKLTVVAHTDRNDRIRIISARRAKPHEIRQYESER